MDSARRRTAEIVAAVIYFAGFFVLQDRGLMAEPIQWVPEVGGNGHFYELIEPPGGASWTSSKAMAEQAEYLGVQGHLATVTSKAENDFIVATFARRDFRAWIGLSDRVVEGRWEWVTREPVTYTNWGGGEPNDCCGGEDYALYETDGQVTDWNDGSDVPLSAGVIAIGFIIEYPVPLKYFLPGDCDESGSLDVSDGICLLGYLFLGDPEELPCGDHTSAARSNIVTLDSNGSGSLDLADAVTVFGYLFLGTRPPAQGLKCMARSDCPDTDACPR